MEFIMELGNIKTIEDIIKIFFITIFTFYMNFKLINMELKIKNICTIVIGTGINIIVYRFIENILGVSYAIIFMIILISILLKKMSQNRFTYSLLITVVSMTINYIMFSLSVIITVVPIILFNIQDTQISLIFILFFYLAISMIFYKTKRFKRGFTFLQEKGKNDYIDMLILNICIVILFCTMIISNYDKLLSARTVVGLIIFSMIMFITIQQSLQV